MSGGPRRRGGRTLWPSRAARTRADRDGGFTFVEMVVTLLVVAIVVPLAYGLVGNISQQSVDLHDTILGLQQDQTAGDALLQYLHGAVTVLPGSDATTLDATIEAGYNTATATQDIATLQAQLVPPAGPGLDASFVVTLTPQGGSAASVGTYYAVDSADPFTYYYYASAGTTSPSCDSVTPTTTTDPPDATGQELVGTHDPCAVLGQVVAVGVDVTFLAGPQQSRQGFQAVQPTTFQTTVYLQNANAPAPTTETSVSFPTSTLTAPETVDLTVSVAPAPDGGSVTVAVTMSSSTISNSCSSPTSLSAGGEASCSFEAGRSGTYTVVATYSGVTAAPGGTSYSASTSPSTQVYVG